MVILNNASDDKTNKGHRNPYRDNEQLIQQITFVQKRQLELFSKQKRYNSLLTYQK